MNTKRIFLGKWSGIQSYANENKVSVVSMKPSKCIFGFLIFIDQAFSLQKNMSYLWREWHPGIVISLAFSSAPSPPSPHASWSAPSLAFVVSAVQTEVDCDSSVGASL